MKIPIKELCSAVSAIDLVPSRAGISTSEFIRLHCSAGRLKLSLAAEIYGQTTASQDPVSSEEWEFFIDRATFVPFVNAALELKQKSPFEFKYEPSKKSNNAQLVVRCGRRRGIFQSATEITGYSSPKEAAGSKLKLTQNQQDILNLAVKYATPDPTIAHLNCVYLLKHKAIMASNQLAAFWMEDTIVPFSAPLPLLLMSVCERADVKDLIVSSKSARVTMPCGYLCQFTNQKAAEEFPYKQIVKNIQAAESYRKQFTISATSLMAVLKRLESYIVSVVKRDMVVSVHGTKGDCTLRLVAFVPQGRFEETVEILHPLRRDVECEWMMSLLLPLYEVASKLGHITVKYDEDSPFLFSSKGMRLLASRKQ